MTDKRALNEREAAAYIGMSVSYLRRDRHEGPTGNRTPGPRWRQIGARTIRYMREDLDAWLEQFEPQTSQTEIEEE